MDIIKTIIDELPKKIESANFEGANIVIYTNDKNFFLESEDRIRKIVNKIKKRIELRASKSLLLEKEKTEKIINEVIVKEAEIQNILFDENRSVVVIEVKKPGLAIGKGGEILRAIKEKTFWIPQVIRSPAIRSKITEAIRHVLFSKEDYRKKFLNSIGKRIYREWSPEKKDEWVRVSFLGGAREVGRSCIFLQTSESKILLDCGLNTAANNSEKFPFFNAPEFNIKEIDAVILSHAHLDHSGLLPYLYKIGYKRPCYMTLPTRDISALLALDFIGVSYKKAMQPLYGSNDVKNMIKHCIDLNYNEVTDITPDVRLTFYNAGHCLGSSMIHLNIGNGLHNLLYTADFKFIKTRILDSATCKFPRLESMIIESTYGSKLDILPPRKEAEQMLIETVKKTIERKGKILIPVLGVGRSQEVMMIIEDIKKRGEFPDIPIYVDGLVWDVTTIHTAYPEFLSANMRTLIFQDKNPFSTEVFKHVASPQERKEVLEGGPCLILATSGMLVGGASVEYFKELASNKRNSIILVCWQPCGSPGRQLKEGIKEVKIEDQTIEVKMEVVALDALSAHAGRNELLAFVNNIEPFPKRILVNHGEASKCLDLASTLYKLHKVEISAPRNLEVVRLR